jgi:hypothetical protein
MPEHEHAAGQEAANQVRRRDLRREIICMRSDLIRANVYWRSYKGARTGGLRLLYQSEQQFMCILNLYGQAPGLLWVTAS